MTSYPIVQVDAFADRPFTGNPAAVMILDTWLPVSMMQAIAGENNLSETAFCVLRPDGAYDLRWFTPTVEIGFCGHATIATAHVLRTEHNLAPPFIFHGQVGRLDVGFADGNYILNAPVTPSRATEVSSAMRSAFDVPLQSAFWAGDNLYLVTDDAEAIRAHQPDFAAIIPLSNHGVGLTARCHDGPYDFVSRFFVPAEGIDEDPVTGSAHAALGPYWATVLGKTDLRARQVSARGGDLALVLRGDRIDIAGPAVTVMRGTFWLPKL